MSFVSDIKTGVKSGHGTALLYAGMLGLIASDILPTGADAVYFWRERKLRDDWKNGKITAKQYWLRETILYYGLNPLYWALIMAAVIAVKGTVAHKTKLAVALIGAGAAVGVVFSNLRKDTAQQQLEDQEKLQLLQTYPELADILAKPEYKNLATQFKLSPAK